MTDKSTPIPTSVIQSLTKDVGEIKSDIKLLIQGTLPNIQERLEKVEGRPIHDKCLNEEEVKKINVMEDRMRVIEAFKRILIPVITLIAGSLITFIVNASVAHKDASVRIENIEKQSNLTKGLSKMMSEHLSSQTEVIKQMGKQNREVILVDDSDSFLSIEDFNKLPNRDKQVILHRLKRNGVKYGVCNDTRLNR